MMPTGLQLIQPASCRSASRTGSIRRIFTDGAIPRLDRGNVDALEVLLDSLRLAIEVVNVDLLAGHEASLFLPFHELLSDIRFECADRCFECRGVLKGGVWDRYELPKLSPRAKKTVPGSTSFQFSVKV